MAIEKTPETRDDYLRRGRLLWTRAARELGLAPHQLDAQTWAQWAISYRGQLRPASWRQYRCSMITLLELVGDDPAWAAIKMLRQADSKLCMHGPLAPRRTSSSKLRRLPLSDLNRLLAQLRSEPGRWSGATALLLQAGIVTGLRPSEWPGARLVETREGPLLRVRNAKHSNGRAHGPERRMSIIVDEAALTVVEAMLEYVEAALDFTSWDTVYEGCRKTLYRTCRALWPRRTRYPTLYSSRHQFAADCKSSGLRPADLAALMGHASIDTAMTHYGRRQAGRGQIKVRPDPEDVRRVEAAMQDKHLKAGNRPSC